MISHSTRFVLLISKEEVYRITRQFPILYFIGQFLSHFLNCDGNYEHISLISIYKRDYLRQNGQVGTYPYITVTSRAT